MGGGDALGQTKYTIALDSGKYVSFELMLTFKLSHAAFSVYLFTGITSKQCKVIQRPDTKSPLRHPLYRMYVTILTPLGNSIDDFSGTIPLY